MHIDTNDPKYRDAASEILRRHDNFEPEANITSAVRDFLILTGLARSEEMVEENPPSEVSRRAVPGPRIVPRHRVARSVGIRFLRLAQ